MATREEFVKAVYSIYKNHGVYVWGGNGEYLDDVRMQKLRNMETSATNLARVLRCIALYYDRGYAMEKCRICDCSGLVIAALRDIKVLTTQDYTAKDLQKMSTPVKLNELKAGDLVFNKSKDASHVGVYVGNNQVIEAQGRDYGVTLNDVDGRWIIGGRLKYFN